jgi:hypothetical protein
MPDMPRNLKWQAPRSVLHSARNTNSSPVRPAIQCSEFPVEREKLYLLAKNAAIGLKGERDKNFPKIYQTYFKKGKI